MSSRISALGLSTNDIGITPSRIPHYVAFNFFLAYIFLSPRMLKGRLGIDHNVSPRQDTSKYGEAAVQKGRITREQLDMLKRNEAAHANSMENFPMLIGSLLIAQQAGVPNYLINRGALMYSCGRVAYGVAYIFTKDYKWSGIRSLLWWVGTLNCLYLLWLSA